MHVGCGHFSLFGDGNVHTYGYKNYNVEQS